MRINSSPKVSIIVPVYNVKKYIAQCIDSVLEQKYTNIELILIDDGSNDGSEVVCEEYAKKDDRIKVIHKKNEGQSVARNIGIDIASGKYLYFLDSDDYIKEDIFIHNIPIMEENGLDLILFSCKTIYDEVEHTNEMNTYQRNENLKYGKVLDGEDMIEELINKKSFLIPPYLYIAKLDLIKKNNIRFYEKIIHEDDLYTPTVILKSKKTEVLENEFYVRRYRKASTVTNEKSVKNYLGHSISFKEFIKVVKEYRNNKVFHALEKLLSQYCLILINHYYILNKEIRNRYKKDFEEIVTITKKWKYFSNRKVFIAIKGKMFYQKMKKIKRKRVK